MAGEAPTLHRVAAPRDGEWRLGQSSPSRASAVIPGRQRGFWLELACGADPARKVTFNLFLGAPRGWSPAKDRVDVLIDGVRHAFEVDGSEGGVVLSNGLFGNSLGVTRDVAGRLLNAREIVVEASSRTGRFAPAIAFQAAGTPQVHATLDRQCATMGTWAEPRSQDKTATATPLPAAPPPAAPPAPPPGTPATASGRYLFDVIKREPYRATFKALTAGGPPWLQRLDGPTTTSTVETVAGEAFERFDICRAHACDEESARILFARDGSRAVGIASVRGTLAVLGDPDPALRDWLTALVPGAKAKSAATTAPPASPPAVPAPAQAQAAASQALALAAQMAVDPASPVVRGVAAVRSGSAVEGFAILKQAADAGDARAAANAGMLLLRGIGTPKDEAAGLTWLRKAAEAGDPFGHLGLGIAWIEGLGVTLDFAQATLALRQALGTPAELEVAALLVDLPDAGLPPRSAPEKAEAERRRWCELARAARHRTASATCTSMLTASMGGGAHLAAIEAALRGRPWTDGLPVAQLYVPSFFADNDAQLRNRVAQTWEFTRFLAANDVKRYLQERGLSLDRPAFSP